MYLPSQYTSQNEEEAEAFMKRFSFATLVTTNDNVPIANHLPFVVSKKGDQIVLSSHFAKANTQWKGINQKKSLVIFSEPHAYISPSHYESEQNVPTWNYIAVHAYGSARLISDKESVLSLLDNMINCYEATYQTQWEAQPENYKERLLNGIVAFEIEVTELQTKVKLSQNRTEREQQNIFKSLGKSPYEHERQVAEWKEMRPLYPPKL